MNLCVSNNEKFNITSDEIVCFLVYIHQSNKSVRIFHDSPFAVEGIVMEVYYLISNKHQYYNSHAKQSNILVVSLCSVTTIQGVPQICLAQLPIGTD